MSMTSKVNPILRQEIVDYLARTGYETSNYAFVSEFGFRYSLRTIQEATQKMTKAAILIAGKSTYDGRVFYSLNTTKPVQTEVGLAATV